MQAVLAAIIFVNLHGMMKQFMDIPALWKSNKVDMVSVLYMKYTLPEAEKLTSFTEEQHGLSCGATIKSYSYFPPTLKHLARIAKLYLRCVL